MQKIFSILILIVSLMFVSGGSAIAGSEYGKEHKETVKMSGVQEEDSAIAQKSQETEKGEAVKEDKDILKEQEEAAEAAEMMEEKK